MPTARIELATFALQVQRSTTKLSGLIVEKRSLLNIKDATATVTATPQIFEFYYMQIF